MDEVDKILKDYVSSHNKTIVICFFYCDFNIQIDHNSTRDLKIDCVHNKEIEKMSQHLLYCIKNLESKAYKFHSINQMTINTISDRFLHEI